MTLFQVLAIVIPFGFAVLAMFKRIEHRITRIETDVAWITKSLNSLDKKHIMPDST